MMMLTAAMKMVTIDDDDDGNKNDGNDDDETKNRLMVTDHSKGVPEILPLNRMTKFDFPPHFLVRLMHSFPMMYNTI